MKKFKFLSSIMIMLFILIAAAGCNYNGKATIKVTNIGELEVTIRIQIGYDQAISYLKTGEHDIYEFKWPGHREQQVTYIRYPRNDNTRQIVETLTLKDGDYLEFEVEFYPET